MGTLVAHLRSNVVGYVALFFALGLGSAWAATELDKNEVKSKHIAPGQVKKSDLGKNAVTSPKVANGSLLGEDFAAGQLPQGEPGPPGEPGSNGATSVTRRISGAVTVSADSTNAATLSCNAGERATGGGYVLTSGSNLDFRPVTDGPAIPGGNFFDVGTPSGWHVEVQNADANNDNLGTLDFRIYVVCASP